MSINSITFAVEEIVYQRNIELVGHFKDFLNENTSLHEDDLATLMKDFSDKYIKKPVIAKENTKKKTAKKDPSDDGEKTKRVSAYNKFLGKMMTMKMSMKEAQAKWAEWKTQNPTIAKDSQQLLDKWLAENEDSSNTHASASSEVVTKVKNPVYSVDEEQESDQDDVPEPDSDEEEEDDDFPPPPTSKQQRKPVPNKKK